MKKTNALFAAAALSFATFSGAAFAQETQVEVTAGMTVYDPEGNEVGIVDSVENGVASLNTGTNVVGLPLDKFASSEQGPTISVTKVQLNEIVEKANAEAAAKVETALVAGAAVVDVNGVAVGTVGSVDGEAVVLETGDGPISLKKEHFMVNQTGALTARVTADQIKEVLANS